MKTIKTLLTFLVAPLCCGLLLSSCGSGSVGSGEVGDQKDQPPIAKAEVIGISDQLSQATTRSGTDVILSGQNSTGVDDPILYYQWKQIDSSGYPIKLLERTNVAVAFKTPKLPADNTTGITLKFELTVIDADGASAKSEVSVKVLPVADPNRYLVNPLVSEAVNIFIASTPGTILNANTPASIHLTPVFSWQDRQGNINQWADDEIVYQTQLTAGEVDEVLSESTAFVRIPMPNLDMDTINQHFQNSERKHRLEIEKLNTANIQWQVSLTASSGQPINAYLVDPATNNLIAPQTVITEGDISGNILLSNTSTNTAIIDIEKLRQALGLESRLTAENYIKCIDPLNTSSNFSDWRNQAGFNSANANDIHTKYINNYDLGFGRDMHIRTDENGNVYSYVSNYSNLENTISNRNAFAIVAMEFSPTPIGNCGDGNFSDLKTGKKIVKFYTFVPDEVNGGFIRTTSMNFDGRGEKYLPGSCTACHGGKTNAELFNTSAAIKAEATDLDSGLMPWDLDAFLYSHATDNKFTDPVYNSFAISNTLSSDVIDLFSREHQESLFKQQNQATLHTLTHDTQKLERFETAIKLIRGWYSDPGELAEMEALDFGTAESPLAEIDLIALQNKLKTLPAGNYNGNFVLKGWQDSSEVQNIYNQVFDRHCRLCHAQMNKPQIDFDSYQEFISNPNLSDYVYAQGAMPMSRLTMDRFWNHFRGETSAAEILRQHLSDLGKSNLPSGMSPGYPQARIKQEINEAASADIILDFDQQLVLDASGSFFSDTYQWSINSSIVSQTPILSMNAGAPGTDYIVNLQTQSQGFTSSTTSRRVKVNNYTPNFSGSINANVSEGDSVQINLLNAICTDLPDSKNCRQYFGDIRSGEKPSLQLEQEITNGQLTWVNEATGLVSFQSTSPAANGSGQFAFRLIDSFDETSTPIQVNINVAGFAAPQIGDDLCQTSAITTANAVSFPIMFGSSSCPDPILNDTAAPGLSLAINNVSAVSQQGGAITLSNGVIRYTPPKFFLGTDSFSYSVIDNSLSQRTATGNISVTVSPSITYTDLKIHFATNCTVPGCHIPAQFGAGPNWSNFATLIQRLDDTLGATSGQLNLPANTTTADILNTRLFIYACSADNHLGGNQLCNTDQHEVAPTNISQLNQVGKDIFQWIEEGAKNN